MATSDNNSLGLDNGLVLICWEAHNNDFRDYPEINVHWLLNWVLANSILVPWKHVNTDI